MTPNKGIIWFTICQKSQIGLPELHLKEKEDSNSCSRASGDVSGGSGKEENLW